MHIFKIIVPVGSFFLMAGCGGDPIHSATQISYADNPQNTMSAVVLDKSKTALMDGNVFVVSIDAESGAGSVDPSQSRIVVRIANDDAGEPTLTLEHANTTVQFDHQDFIENFGYMKTLDGRTYRITPRLDRIDNYFQGASQYEFHVPFEFVTWTNEELGETYNGDRMFGVAGLRTPEQDLPLSDAIYDGVWSGTLFSTAPNNRSVPFEMDAQLRFDASSSELSGKFFGISEFNDSGALIEGDLELTLVPSGVQGEGFETTLFIEQNSCNSNCPVVGDSTVSLDFFGPAGQELGGAAFAVVSRPVEAPVILNGAVSASTNDM